MASCGAQHEAAQRVVVLLRMAKGVPADVREALAYEVGMSQSPRQYAQGETFRNHGDLANQHG